MNKEEVKILLNIFRPYSNVFVFGSRATGKNKEFSDLDICLKDKISPSELCLLKEKLENSNLSFIVDIVEYDKVDDYFKKILDCKAIPLKIFLQNVKK